MPKVGDPVKKPYSWVTPAHQLYVGDCIGVMATLPAGCVDLAFCDPPFNIGWDYDEYNDRLDRQVYLGWSRRWLGAVQRLLSPVGSIYVSICLRYQAEVKVLMSELGLNWRDTVCWHYTFGPHQKRKLTPSWVPIHHFSVNPKDWTWNADAIKVPSSRQRYGDKRAREGGKNPDNVWVLNPRETEGCFGPDQNAVLENRVCGNYKERTAHPCQMPEALLSRIITASSNPGDVVLDPFVGSGTTSVVAARLGRRSIGIDTSKNYIRNICVPRLESELNKADGGR